MRASLAGVLAVCALFGIPRLAGELREYRRQSQQPAPAAVSVPPESRPAASIAPPPKAPDAAVPQKQTPVQLVSLQRDNPPAATKPASPASQAPVNPAPAGPPNEADLIAAIQKELARLGYYDGPVTNRWNRPVRGAAREFLRKTGSRARYLQPTAELLTALKAAEPVRMHAASPPEPARTEEKPAGQSGSSVKEPPLVKESPPVKETLPKQSMAAPAPAPHNEDYLPPWMTGKTDRAGLASQSEAARSDGQVEARNAELAAAPSSIDEAPKRIFHRHRHAERRRHYVSRSGYYGRRQGYFFPF